MKYRIMVEDHASQMMIHTVMSGVMSIEERNSAAVETVHVMRENNLHKVIWDIRDAELDYSLVHSHTVVLNLAALGLKSEDSVAVIYFHNKEQHEHARLAAHNRAIYNLDYFQSFEEGIRWLAGRYPMSA